MSDSRQSFRVASWNIQGGNYQGDRSFTGRSDIIRQVFSDIRADLLGVQEVVASNLEVLTESNPCLTFTLGKILDPTNTRLETLPIGWNPSRFSVLTRGTKWHSPTPNESSIGWDARYIRAFSWVLLHDDLENKQLLFINTHFDHKGHRARKHSARIILRFIQEYYPTIPTIVVGDLNCGPYYPKLETEYRRVPYDILIRGGLKDAYRHVHQKWPPRNTFHAYCGKSYQPDRYGTWMIDFVLVKDLEPVSARIHEFDDDRLASDHYPVIAELCYPTSS